MILDQSCRPAPASACDRLLEAGVKLLRQQGFSGTSVDQLCGKAGVAKGAFFAAAPYHHHSDPAQRVLGYIDLRTELIAGPMVQEAFLSSDPIQAAFNSSILGMLPPLQMISPQPWPSPAQAA